VVNSVPKQRISGVQRQRYIDEVYQHADALLAKYGPDRRGAAPSIARGLAAEFPDRPTPSARAVSDWIERGVIRGDPSGIWSLAGASPGEAARVLPVLAAVIERTEGRRTFLTTAEAAMVARVSEAAPDLPPWQTYQLAHRYIDAGSATEDLDQLLAFAPWRDQAAAYNAAIAAGWIRRHHVLEPTEATVRAALQSMLTSQGVPEELRSGKALDSLVDAAMNGLAPGDESKGPDRGSLVIWRLATHRGTSDKERQS
jgi:hypothetical protein